jgi:hypothetical protein
VAVTGAMFNTAVVNTAAVAIVRANGAAPHRAQ